MVKPAQPCEKSKLSSQSSNIFLGANKAACNHRNRLKNLVQLLFPCLAYNVLQSSDNKAENKYLTPAFIAIVQKIFAEYLLCTVIKAGQGLGCHHWENPLKSQSSEHSQSNNNWQ